MDKEPASELGLKPGGLGRHKPVSYTHLDVYKRQEYTRVTRPNFENAFEALLEFAEKCEKMIPQLKMTVVDVLPEEEIEASRELAESIGVELRVRRYA